MTMTRTRIWQLGLVVATAGLIACNSGSSGGSSSSSGDTGQMSLAVSDGPVDDAESVLVRFSAVEFNPASGDRFTIEFDDIQTIDLLQEAQGDQSVILFEDEEIPAGDYNWIRLRLEPSPDSPEGPQGTQRTTSQIVFLDGAEFDLFVPGGLQAGLQTVGPFEIEANESQAYTVDIDLRKAIVRGDNPAFGGEHYRLRRALRLRLIENVDVGHITGVVDEALIPDPSACTPDCPGVAVYVFEGEDADLQDIRQIDEETDDPNNPVVTANVRFLEDEDTGNWEYRYTAGFLSPGLYTVALTFAADQDDPTTEDPIPFEFVNPEVEVIAGSRTRVDFPDDAEPVDAGEDEEGEDDEENGNDD